MEIRVWGGRRFLVFFLFFTGSPPLKTPFPVKKLLILCTSWWYFTVTESVCWTVLLKTAMLLWCIYWSLAVLVFPWTALAYHSPTRGPSDTHALNCKNSVFPTDTGCRSGYYFEISDRSMQGCYTNVTGIYASTECYYAVPGTPCINLNYRRTWIHVNNKIDDSYNMGICRKCAYTDLEPEKGTFIKVNGTQCLVNQTTDTGRITELAPCGNNNGGEYQCEKGYFKNGTVCDGTGFEDTQTCQLCVQCGLDQGCPNECTGMNTTDTQDGTCGPVNANNSHWPSCRLPEPTRGFDTITRKVRDISCRRLLGLLKGLDVDIAREYEIERVTEFAQDGVMEYISYTIRDVLKLLRAKNCIESFVKNSDKLSALRTLQ